MKNLRDLSYVGLKPNMLIRSDALGELSNEDIALLRKHNVKTIIDIRGLNEIESKPDQIVDGINYLYIPLTMTKEPKTKDIKGMQFLDMIDAYTQLVDIERKESYQKIFEVLLNNNEGILYHCSEGKDRTGTLTAIILLALGIDKEIIYQDYLETNNSPLSYKEFAKTLPEDVRELFIKEFSANKEYLDVIFNEIDKIYGNSDNFLLEVCNIDNNKRQLLKEKYLR